MRDKEFAVAKKALIEGTQDKSKIPESFSLVGKNALYGKKGKTHTLILPARMPHPQFDHANLRVIGDGRVLEDRDEEVHSWNRNFYNWMTSFFCVGFADDAGFFEDGKLSIKDNTDTLRTSVYPYMMREGNVEDGTRGYSADKEDDTQGVVVGLNTGATAESFDGYVLDSQIDHGVAAGEFYYATHQYPAVTVWDDPNFLHTMTRYFDNFNAGQSAISVGEVGLYANQAMWSSQFIDTMVARHVPASPISVPFRAQLAVSLAFDLTFDKAGPLTRNCYNMIAGHSMSLNLKDGTASMGDGKLNIQRLNGTIYDGAQLWSYFYINYDLSYALSGGAGGDGSGIMVGDGNTPFDFDDYVLDSQIMDGVAGGELQYSAYEVGVKVWDDPDFVVSHGRTFTNGSPGNVTVREVGVPYNIHVSGYSYLWYQFLYYRGVLGSPVTLAPTESLRVVYQPYVTYP